MARMTDAASPSDAPESRPRPRRSGAMQRRMARWIRDLSASRPMTPLEEVRWELVRTYAGLLDAATADGDGKQVEAAADRLARALSEALDGMPGDDRDARPADGADIFALPAVGNTT